MYNYHMYALIFLQKYKSHNNKDYNDMAIAFSHKILQKNPKFLANPIKVHRIKGWRTCPEEERTQGSCGVAMGEQEQMFLPRLSSLWIRMSSNLWFPIFASLSSRFIIWGGSDGSKRIQLA